MREACRMVIKLDLVEVVHVELADKRREVAMLEVFGEDLVGELSLFFDNQS